MEQRYHTGEEVHIGDRVRYAGHPGIIVFVIDRSEFSPEFPAANWDDEKTGIMLKTEAYGLVMLQKPDEDVEFLGRGTPHI